MIFEPYPGIVDERKVEDHRILYYRYHVMWGDDVSDGLGTATRDLVVYFMVNRLSSYLTAGTGKYRDSFSQDKRHPGRGSNPEPFEY